MLILTRHVDEAIIIGNNIEIKVLNIKKDQIRIGITAPKDVSIRCEEMCLRIKKDKKQDDK